MLCTKCGDEMNHHADKLIYLSEGREAANLDASLGGLVEETYAARLQRSRLENRRPVNYRPQLNFAPARLTP